tara:strand:+ start:43 stop:1443 length:1401 start_codon:yes stop_codon:yes gene_type:complete
MAITQYKGNFYDTNDPQQNAELLRLQRAENLKKAMQSLQPNRQDAPRKKLEAANLLAQNQALLNARTGVPPVSPNTYNVLSQNNGLLEVAPPNTNINERAARVRSLLDSQQVDNNNTASNQVDQSSSQPAQPQPKKTLGQRAGGLLDRVSDAYMGAAPIFAVAQEFQKAGALRPVGAAMQGDPYGKMMQIQQGRKEANNIASLRAKYDGRIPQELNDKDFVDTVKKIIDEDIKNSGSRNNQELINQAKENTRLEENQKEGLGNAKSAFGAGSTVLSAVGSIGEFTPYGGNFAVLTQKARSAINANAVATKQFSNNANATGRIAKYTIQSINNLIPVEYASDGSTIVGYKSEKKALEDYQNLRSTIRRTVEQLENQLLNPDSEITKAKKNDFISAINLGSQLLKEYDQIIGSLKGEIKGTDDNAGAKKRTYDPSLLPPDPNQTRESALSVVYENGQLDIVANAMGVK